MKKPAALSANLVAVKGAALPVQDMPPRSGAFEAPKSEADSGLQPLNFKVPAEFRREFKTFAAAHDLKLNELLMLAFANYSKQPR